MTQAKKTVAKGVSFSPGTYPEFSGTAQARTEAVQELFLHSGIAAVCIAILLTIVVGNMPNLLLILVNLPFALVGGVFWYDATVGESVYDPWFSNTILQDNPPDTTDTNAAPPSPGGTGVGVTQVDSSTHINSLLVVDLDGDGKNDIIGTLDRRSGSGLSDDRLVWYRNTKTDEP